MESAPVEVSRTPAGVSKKLVESTPVEVSTTSESVGAGGAGGRGAGGVGLDFQKKLLAPRALKARPRVEQGV